MLLVLRNNTSYHGDDGLDDEKLFVFCFFWLVTRSGRRSRDVGVKEELSLEKVQDRQTKQELLWSICGAELLALLALLARAPGLTLTRWVKFRLLSRLF